jgi:hypothetical protein
MQQISKNPFRRATSVPCAYCIIGT